MKRDSSSVVTPDVRKAKKGIRYRLSTLQELHKLFIVDQSVERSYSQFTRHVPEYIIKPQPEDCGTCLCMLCLNPELKLEAITRNLEATMTLDIVKEKDNANSVNALIENLKNSGKTFNYLEWSKQKEKEVK